MTWYRNTMLDDARFYRDQGISVIAGNGKVPAFKWQEYRERYATDKELERWFADTRHSILAVCGKLSNLTVLDADSPEAEEFIREHTTTERVVKTPRGKHFHFDFKALRNRVGANGISIDIRSDGGLSVLPPTDGYSWASHGVRGRLGELFSEPKPKKRKEFFGPVEHLVQRTERYLKKVEGAVTGSGGHNTTFRVACIIADRLANHMTPEDALPLMEEWNQTCEPAWTETELLHKLKDAWGR